MAGNETATMLESNIISDDTRDVVRSTPKPEDAACLGAITNFVMDAVNGGYQFVLPRDAVSGYPRQYAESVIDNTLSLLATVTTTDDVVAAWAELAKQA